MMRSPRVTTAVGAGVVLWGVAVGLVRLHDNSFLTHVATGRLIVAHGSVPTRDPYSFTAHGHPWIVESWLASLLYGWVERVAGSRGLQVVHAGLAAVLAGLAWILTRPARQLAGRIIVAAGALAVGTGYWSPRPLLIALVLFAIVILTAERDTSESESRTARSTVTPWVLVPVMCVWVNVHGSWPLGLGYLALRAVGRRLDGRDTGRVRALLGTALLGTAAGAINPLGPRLLAYPLVVLTHHEAFAGVAEWQAPMWTNPVNAVLGAALVLAFVLLVRRRGAMDDALVTVAFAATAVVAARNVPVASLAVTPVLARGLAGLGSLTGERRVRSAAFALGAWGALGAVVVASAWQLPAYDLSAYPVNEVTWMQHHHLVPGRVAAPDYVGNYLEFRYGTHAEVFMDDRVDVFPPSTEHAYGVLLRAATGWQAVLDHEDFRSVLWPAGSSLAKLLTQSTAWKVVLHDRRWLVAVRSPTPTLTGQQLAAGHEPRLPHPSSTSGPG